MRRRAWLMALGGLGAAVLAAALVQCTTREPRAPAAAALPSAAPSAAPTEEREEEREEAREEEREEQEEEREEAEPGEHAAEREHTRGACAPDLARCPLDGCSPPGSAHALVNRLKRTTTRDDGRPIAFDDAVPVSFAQLARLEREAARALPPRADRDIEPRDRALLQRLDAGGAALGEGSAVRLAGYIAPPGRSPSAGPHEGRLESVNCRVRARPAWTALDFHVPVTASARGDDECHGVVVEMIPQGRERHPSWTLPALRELASRRALVLFVGRLFYDNEHVPRPDCRARRISEPKRMTVWEVHPVVEMYVCDDDACSAASRRGWTRVD